jgi:two-component system, chemotaxis family, chemotaxis protein CheY
MKCLIVDDEIICRKAVVTILEEVAECDEAADGEEALAKFSQALGNNEPYDVVFLDILMPGIDGHQTAQAIREVECRSSSYVGVKIIMLTVLDSVNDAMTSFCFGQSTAYLVKPPSEEKFLGTFKKLGLL